MNKIKQVWQAISRLWMRIWFEGIDPRPLAAFRIAMGIYLLGYFLRYTSIVELSFSDQGVYSPYLIPDIAPDPAIAWLIFGATLLAIVAMTVGFYSRVATVLVTLGFLYHFFLNFSVTNSNFDRLNLIILFVLCWSDVGAAWSWDARGQKTFRLIPAWQTRLLQFQLASMYFGTGLAKLFNVNWYDGRMLKSALNSPWSTPVAATFLEADWPPGFFTLLTWSVVAFELAAGFTLYFKRTKIPTMVVGTMFHLGNIIFLQIPGFLDCIAMYALFWDFGPAKAQTPPQPSAPPESESGQQPLK